MRRLTLIALLISAGFACGGGNRDYNNPATSARDTDEDGDGFTPNEGDCNDDDPDVHPDAHDPAGDGKDANCDGMDGVDADEDGYVDMGSGGDDCNDDDPSINPGELEIPVP